MAVCAVGVGPSERNPVRTKASFDLTGHMFSFRWDFVPAGPRFAASCLLFVMKFIRVIVNVYN